MTERQRLTIDDARHLDHKELIDRAYAILAQYEANPPETQAQLEARIARTLDELPDVYAWFLHLHAFFDHWTDWSAEQHGGRSLEYKSFREKRDAMENLARAAKLRYEGTSRRLTQIQGAQDEARMPRGR